MIPLDNDDVDYRATIYERYVTAHQGEITEARSHDALECDILPHVPSDRSTKILDIGCGQGQLVSVLQVRGYRSVSGIDASAEQVALAVGLGRDSVRVGDLFDVATREAARFDVVTAIDLVEHFDRRDAQRVFQAVADLLRPGGLFILRTPNATSPFVGRLLFGDLSHGMAFNDRSLAQVCQLTGFSAPRVYPVRPCGRSWRKKVRRAIWAILEPLIVLPLVIETGVLRGHVVTQNLVSVSTKGET